MRNRRQFVNSFVQRCVCSRNIPFPPISEQNIHRERNCVLRKLRPILYKNQGWRNETKLVPCLSVIIVFLRIFWLFPTRFGFFGVFMGLSNRFLVFLFFIHQTYFSYKIIFHCVAEYFTLTKLSRILSLANESVQISNEYRTNFERTKIRIDLYCIHCYFPIKLIFYAMIVTNKTQHFHMFMSANPKSAIILSHL